MNKILHLQNFVALKEQSFYTNLSPKMKACSNIEPSTLTYSDRLQQRRRPTLTVHEGTTDSGSRLVQQVAVAGHSPILCFFTI